VKIKIVLSVFVLGAIVALSMFYLNGSAGAADPTGTVSPSVTVNTTLSLTMEEGTEKNVQWGGKAAGTTQTGTIQAVIGANIGWNLTVQATAGFSGTNELTDGNQRIASSHFTYTSAAGIPAPPYGTGVTATPFGGSAGTPVWAGGPAYDGCKVAITYRLQIPAIQPPGTYTATHTYTLTSSS